MNASASPRLARLKLNSCLSKRNPYLSSFVDVKIQTGAVAEGKRITKRNLMTYEVMTACFEIDCLSHLMAD